MEKDDNGTNLPNLGRSKVPEFGWKVKLNHVFHEKRNQNLTPRLSQIPPLLPLALRYLWYVFNIFKDGRQPLMNYMKMPAGKQIYGVPIGGIGGGTIGRGFKGEFCRYQLRPGLYEYNTVSANQFIVTIQNRNGKTIYQQVLSPYRKPKTGLSAWNWNYDGSMAQYCGLYPRAWTTYDIPEHGVRLTCRQVSPVIPHNYKDSSVPGAVFVWMVENLGDEVRSVSITLTFKNGSGSKDDKTGESWCEVFDRVDEGMVVSGVQLHQTIHKMPCTYGLAARQQEGVRVSRTNHFDPCGNGRELWEDLLIDGELDSPAMSSSHRTRSGEQIGCAVCVKLEVAGGSTGQAEIALVWDMPKIHFTGKCMEYYRYYTKWFGNEGKAAPIMCFYALANIDSWEDEIEKWQKPILEDPDLPDWYKSAIFNELYFVADGGSVWLLAEEDSLKPEDPRRDYGRFGYLEGQEYRMYNTYDVHFYASFALATLWPQLQASIQYDIGDAVGREDSTQRSHLYNGKVTNRKVRNSVPHDLGDPDEEPFLRINAYPIHDVSEWRDLNLKFVLQCYRDLQFGVGQGYLKALWPRARAVMERALTWDADGDGLVENRGAPDQTYDSWVMTGPSSYCGSLWLAALYCMSKMAELVGEMEAAGKYRSVLERGKLAFEEKLWNGRYYNFDCSGAEHSKSIMSDQLCGQWYLRACGVTEQVFPTEHVRSALNTIYNFNVLQFRGGTMGAVNGMLPDGKVDTITIQSEEVWTGVVYGLAALMIHEGMVEEGFKTASGIYNTVYNRIGMGFETPEALYAEKHYRAIGYMRPLSIWAMQHAWQQRSKHQS